MRTNNDLFRPNVPAAELPIDWRVRGLEQRPLVGDADEYVAHLKEVGFTVSTIGAMNGRGFAGYPTERLPQVEGMDPTWITGVLERAHEENITLICWNVFNVQDVRDPNEFQIAKRYPQWQMEYISDPSVSYSTHVGMCVLSSPYLSEHVKVLKEIVALGPDAMWFDGFYLGGNPHPVQPGCVCEHCRKKFREDYDRELPIQVDWADPTFKRWIRWRNQRLIAGARMVTAELSSVRPGIPVTFNYNHWPFATKDWANGIPLWSTREYGVSQHAYTPDERFQWVMLGYKAQLSHDLNPSYSDIWRTGRPIFDMDDSESSKRKHELQIRLFTLAALSAGTIPWRSSHEFSDVQKQNNAVLESREHTFAKAKIAPVAVAISQNTHDFWGHIPGTAHLTEYRNAVLGTWLLLTENHIPFRFVFDNDLDAGDLDGLSALILPSMACVSETQAAAVTAWVSGGGQLITTGPTGELDEWGEAIQNRRLADSATRHFSVDPGSTYAADRSSTAAAALLEALADVTKPYEISAPPSVQTTLFQRDANTLILHLMNVSAFYRWSNGCGFAGVEGTPAAGPTANTVSGAGRRGAESAEATAPETATASDAEVGPSTDAGTSDAAARTFETRPAEGVRVRLTGYQVTEVRSTAGGTVLTADTDGWYAIPEIADHDALVITLR